MAKRKASGSKGSKRKQVGGFSNKSFGRGVGDKKKKQGHAGRS